jgi:hypothetical protein
MRAPPTLTTQLSNMLATAMIINASSKQTTNISTGLTKCFMVACDVRAAAEFSFPA